MTTSPPPEGAEPARGRLALTLIAPAVGAVAGAALAVAVGQHPEAPAGPQGWALTGAVGGALGPLVALWAATALQLRPDDDLNTAAGVGFCVSPVAGGLGGVVGGAVDGAPGDLLGGALWGVLLGFGVGFLALFVVKFLGRPLRPVGGPVTALGLACGAAAALGAAAYQPAGTNEMLPGVLRLLAGGAGAALGLTAWWLAARQLPGRGSLVPLALGVLAAGGAAAVLLARSPLVAGVAHSGAVRAAALSADGELVMVAGEDADKAPRIVRVGTGEVVGTFPGGGYTVLNDVAFTTDGMRVLGAAQSGSSYLWAGGGASAPVHEVRIVIPTQRISQAGVTRGESDQPVQFLSALPGDRLAFLAAGSTGALGSDVALWDLSTGKLLLRLDAHKDQVTALSVSADGRWAVTGGKDKTLMLWKIDPGARLVTPERTITTPEEVSACAVSPDGKRVAAAVAGIGHRDFTIRAYDAATGGEARALPGHARRVTALAFLPDGRLLSASEDLTARLWDGEAGAELRRIHTHMPAVRLKVSSDGRRVLVVPAKGRPRLFAVP